MTPAPEELIACPQCDALYRIADVPSGQRAICHRCHTVLISPRRFAGSRIIALSLASVVLVVGAVSFPFLRIEIAGLRNDATLFDAALAFADGPFAVLSLFVVAMIVFLPLLRFLLTLYAIAPIVYAGRAVTGAATAFRWSEGLRPWAMAEIFVIGCAVALIKVADLARIEFGPAFYMFAILVVFSVVQDTLMCRWTVWSAIDRT